MDTRWKKKKRNECFVRHSLTDLMMPMQEKKLLMNGEMKNEKSKKAQRTGLRPLFANHGTG